MKFGKKLKSQIEPEWETYYLNYSLLKAVLKRISSVDTGAGGWTSSLTVQATSTGEAADEEILTKHHLLQKDTPLEDRDFHRVFEREVQKINDFAVMKGTEIRNQLEILSQTLEDGGLNDVSSRESARDRADQIALDFLRFEKYVNINFMGVDKILKKHDKLVPQAPCKQFYVMKIRDMPWITQKYDDIPVLLSNLHTKIRADTSSMKDKQAEGGKQAFVRKTTKYWVRIEDISKVKLMVLRHLPVFQFTQARTDSQLINSVYLDNRRLELCHGRLDKLPQAQAIRFRWYDTPLPGDVVFVERKTHRDSWTGEESVKERFPLKASDILPFLAGKLDLEKKVEKMRKAGKSSKEIEEFQRLSTEVNQAIQSKQLEPCVRTQYTRTAFQIPFDATVRISIDTNLCMILENNNDHGRWYKDPNKSLPPAEITRFPFAVVEVKLQTAEGAEPPAWVAQELLDSGMFKEVHKFSKFIHGCTQMIRPSMKALPYWINDVQLREYYEEVSRNNAMGRKVVVKSASAMNLELEEQKAILRGAPFQERTYEANNVGTSRTPLLGGGGYDETESKVKPKGKKPYKGNALVLSPIGIAGQETEFDPSLVEPKTCLCVPIPETKLPVKVPMKIEPKVFFANERTFLSWMHMAVTLSGISLVLTNAVDAGVAQAAGLTMLVIAIMFILYAIFVFQVRAMKLRKREEGMYDERVGPTLAVLALLLGMLLVLLMALKEIPTAREVRKIK